ncbi:MAG: malto-oligosyltrehalose trehalohydrolase [Alphaproteobacteria bacterium]
MSGDFAILEATEETARREPPPRIVRRLPVGAEQQPGGGVHFRIWAPRVREIAVEIQDAIGGAHPIPLQAEAGGYWSALVAEARPGMRYGFRTDTLDTLLPDPVSRFQPEGPHGPSEIVDPTTFGWTDQGWRGRKREEMVVYEMHVGSFTQEGSWEAASRELPELAALGITCIELMPVADFPGCFGWGYDGVDLFAPTRLYGSPDDFRRFIDRAHAHGIAVILDVVYNHFGPDGNYAPCFSQSYFSDRYDNEWGDPINFDGTDSAPVREFFLANAGYWIDEYHLDGLRLDATQQIFDASPDNIMAAIVRRVREAAGDRETFIVGENEPQHSSLVRPPERGGCGFDALWNDDLHHAAMVALTGRREAYYTDYRGAPGEFIAAAKYGFLYQGQHYVWQGKRRGAPSLDLPAETRVVYLQNHDQVANSANGLRVHALTSPGRWRAMTAYLLLMPGIPMLFQGQEFAASAPFLYFADHRPDLVEAVRRGRAEFLSQFPSIADPELRRRLTHPADEDTFRRCILDLTERERHAPAYALHRDLLALRRDDPVLRRRPARVDGAVIGEQAWVLRFFAEATAAPGTDNDAARLLIVDLGRDLALAPMPEPLLAPLEDRVWQILWSSEAPCYGGGGTPPLYRNGVLHIPGESALVLAPGPLTPDAAPELRPDKQTAKQADTASGENDGK